MRPTPFWIALVAVLASSAAAQSAPAASASKKAPSRASVADDRATLIKHEDGWARALVKRDRSYFESRLASGFVYTEDNRLITREKMLEEMLGGSDVVTGARNEEMVVHLFGGTGVVTGLLIVSGRGKDGAFEHRYRYTDTWAKQTDGSWKMVAAQDYLIPAKR